MRPLPPERYRDIVRRALAEDLGTATSRPRRRCRRPSAPAACSSSRRRVCSRAWMSLSRLPAARTRWSSPSPGGTATAASRASDRGGRRPARALLIAERTALNFLQRLSGIATRARAFVDAAAGRIKPNLCPVLGYEYVLLDAFPRPHPRMPGRAWPRRTAAGGSSAPSARQSAASAQGRPPPQSLSPGSQLVAVTPW